MHFDLFRYVRRQRSCIWILIGLTLKMMMIGHTGLVRALHFDQDKIVSGSYDQSIRVWDIRTGAQLHHFEACHSSWVFDVMFDETKIIRYAVVVGIDMGKEGRCVYSLSYYYFFSTSQDQKIVIMDFAHGMDTQHII